MGLSKAVEALGTGVRCVGRLGRRVIAGCWLRVVLVVPAVVGHEMTWRADEARPDGSDGAVAFHRWEYGGGVRGRQIAGWLHWLY